MLAFNHKYFLWALALFAIEVLIALFIHDSFVRPYVGDYLVVMLIYCSIKSGLNASATKVAIGALLFSYLIEVLQFFQLVKWLGLEKNVIAQTVIGYGFSWWDLLAYTLGTITVVMLDKKYVE